VVRFIETKSGKILSQNSSSKKIDKNKKLSVRVNQIMPTKMVPGNYNMVIRILDGKNKVVDQNKFAFQVIKKK
jgi:hypothetical protein